MRNLAAFAALLVAATLSGCTSPGDPGAGFTITPPAAAGGEHLFEATVDAENYTWDLGDRLTTLHGKSVRHAYDVKDATLHVTLKARTGKDTKDYGQKLVLGTGQNQKPTFLLEAQTDWAVTGETVAFSSSASRDPEGDPLRFSWSCLRTGDAVRQPPHAHPTIGIPFASAPAGSVTSGKADRTLPAPDATYTGDFCEALGSGTRPSTGATTIAGAFARSGIYEIYLLAADAAHPTTSGSFRVYVTPPAERPAPVFHRNHTVVFSTPGAGGSLQGACESAPERPTCDRWVGTFSIPLPGLAGSVALAYDDSNPATKVAWTLRLIRGDAAVASGEGPGTVELAAGKLLPESYQVVLNLSGPPVSADWRIAIALDMDPAKVY